MTSASPWAVLVFLTSFHIYVTQGQSVVVFQRPSQCPGKVLSASLTYGQIRVRSKVQCAALCLPDFSCHSFIFQPDRGLCHLGSEPSFTNCSNMQPTANLKHYDMATTCHNGGVLQVGGTCLCPRAYIGNICDIAMTDCSDVSRKAKLKKDGVYWIRPSASPYPFQVYCRMIKKPRTYFMNRIHNDVNFTRSWDEYKRGFGNMTKDFWLGLEKLHFLTVSGDYELRFRVRLKSTKNVYQIYKNVVVGDEQQQYRLWLLGDSTRGDLGDCLSSANGSSFSTPDRDNDNNNDTHCASLHQAGFWFHGDNCTLCNPTGPLIQPDNQQRLGIPNEVFWERSLGDTAPYKLGAFLINVVQRRKRSSSKG
ncbi:hypothetical protein ACOMHN_010348 [Nucella lapillus]